MPVHQTFGIIIAASAALLGIPKLLVELTAAARLEKRLEVVQKVAEKAEPDGARATIIRQRDQLSRKLAATYRFRPTKRDYLGAAAAIATPALIVVAVVLIETYLPYSEWVTPTFNVVIVLSVLVILNGYVRVRTLSRNRRLYAELGCPDDPPVLRIPPIHRVFGRRVTVEAVLAKAHEGRAADERTTLTERAKEAVGELEQRYYHTRKPRNRAR